jgi:hypothetical protein
MKDEGRPPSALRPLSIAGLGAALALGFACLAAAALAAPRVNLVHVAYYNSCAIRTYAYHWQNPERQPETLRYDFVNSPDSLIVLALWVDEGPSWNLSQALPLDCPRR